MDVETRRALERLEHKVDALLALQHQQGERIAKNETLVQHSVRDSGAQSGKIDLLHRRISETNKELTAQVLASRVEKARLAGIAAGVGAVITILWSILQPIITGPGAPQ